MAKDKVSTKVVDFSNVKDRGAFNTRRVQEGDYRARIVKVEDHEKDGNFSYLFHFKLDKYSQNTYPYYCPLSDKSLWKLRNLLVAAGLSVPKKRMKLDPSKAVNKSVGVTMEDDEYEGKMKSVIGAVFPVSELAGMTTADDTDDDADVDEDADVGMEDDDEDTAPKKSKKAKKGKKGKKSAAKDETEEVDLDEL